MKRVGIVGAGGMGGTHARHLAALGTAEIGMIDHHPEKIDVLAQSLPVRNLGSWDELVAWADGIDICTPTPSHADLALSVIRAGLPVLVEKPLALTLDRAREVVLAAAEANVPLMVGHVVRYFPEFRTAHRMVQEGRVGTPAAIRMRRGGGAPKADWFFDHDQSGGILIDLAVHDFDWLRWTFGEVSHLFARSIAAESNQGADYALTTLTFDSGAVAHVESTWMDPAGGRVTLEVCGSDGMFEYDSRNTATVRTHTNSVRVEAPLIPADDPYRKQMADFVAMLEGTPPPVSGVDGFMALSIGIAARQSAQTGKVVSPERF